MNDDRSILHALEEQGRKAPRVSLDGAEPNEKATERYEIVGEIARGGVGLVYRGRDTDLGRDVALKVLRDDLLRNPDLIRRFVEEAQIGGQLQHPGIVPVYELGLRSDARPYFAMKLVKGETLAARLAKRASPSDERRSLLTVFREVCRTMAYAHARGVIHRDLKPSNVMIGSFGEVQVVDWGFAKVLRRGGVDDEGLLKKARRAEAAVSTVRSGEGSAESVAGSVMGTPAYMPPEQAMGRIEDLDEKSDIFSLGAILLEILTGAAPYTSESGDDRMAAAAKAVLAPALARLRASDADPALVSLCRRCLEPLPKDRPASAELLADEVAASLTRAEGRAHRNRLRALRAETDADEQRRARRFTTVTGAAIVALLAVATAAFLFIDAGRARRSQERRSAIDAALQEASRQRSAKNWPEALAAVQRAADLGHEDPLVSAIRAEAAEAAKMARELAEEKALLADLERARAMRGDHYENEEVDAAYAAAIAGLWPDGEVDTARLAASGDAPAFAAAFDAWALLRRDVLEGKDWKTVDAWARAVDPRADALRDAMADRDGPGLVRLLGEMEPETIPVARIPAIAAALSNTGEREAALGFLRGAQRLHPADYWINSGLAWIASKLGDEDLHLRHRTVGLAIRPESLEARHWFGIALEKSGDIEAALEVWLDAFRNEPDWIHGLQHIATALTDLGREDEAMAALRDALDRNPDDYRTHLSLGIYEFERGRYEAAAASIGEAAKRNPKSVVACTRLGHALDRSGDPEGAEAAYRRGIDLAGDDAANLAVTCSALGDLLRRKGELEEAMVLAQRAVDLTPESAEAQNNLALVFGDRGDKERALELLERARELAPDSAPILTNLADALTQIATATQQPVDPIAFDEAIVLLREAVALDPERSYTRIRLGNALAHRQRFREAIGELERAVGLAPESAEARGLLGNVLNSLGRYERAVPHLEKAIGLAPPDARMLQSLATAYEGSGRGSAAIGALERATEIDPGRALTLARLLERLGRYEEAIPEYRRAIDHGSETTGALAGMHYSLGTALYRVGRHPEALGQLQQSIDLDEDYAEAWCNQGWCLREMGRWPEAVEKLRKGHRLGVARGNWGYASARWIERTERMVALAPRLEEALGGNEVEATPEERATLAEMLRVKGRPAVSVRFYQEAFGADPTLAEYGRRHLYMALRAAAAGGEAHRGQALSWCRQYVEAVRRHLPTDPGRVWRETHALTHNPELAPIREAPGLPDDWKRLWSHVESLRAQAKSAMAGRSAADDRPFAGFYAATAEAGRPLVVSDVHDGAPAAAAGVRRGDVITKLCDFDVTDFPSFRIAIGNFEPGDEVTLVLKRGEETIEVRLTLARSGDHLDR